jgi:hypothetical protein
VATTGAYQSTLDTSIGVVSLSGAVATVRGGYYDGTNYWVAITDPVVNGVYAFSAASGANVANRDFGLALEIGSGIVWDGAAFRGWSSSSSATKIYTYTSWDWTTESPVYWAGYSWYDSIGTPHETAISPRQGITLGRRRQLTVSTPAIPGAATEPPDQARVYLARSPAEPVPTNYHLQATDALTVRSIASFAAAGAADPASNSFPAATPAELRGVTGVAANPVTAPWSLKGDGTKVGFLRYVPITLEVVLGGTTPGSGTVTVSPATIPTDGSVYAVALAVMIRDSAGADRTLSILNWDGSTAGWAVSSGVAGRGGAADVALVVTGGTGNAQIKYSVSSTTGVTIWIEVVGYWTYA